MTDNKEFSELVEEMVKQADELESECINQTSISLWKVKLKLSGIQQLIFMAEEIIDNI